MPFDIDPAAMDAGETHFEQIYDRAKQAVLNAVVAFDNARGVTQQLRQQFDSVYDLAESLSAQETDYHNRLIEIYGYPYSDDIGPTGQLSAGLRRTGPDGLADRGSEQPRRECAHQHPDPDSAGRVRPGFHRKEHSDVSTNHITGLIKRITPTTDRQPPSTNNLATITITVNDNGLKVKPASWTGSRRAQGELQLAMADYIQAWYGLEAKKTEYEQTLRDSRTKSPIGSRTTQ